MMGMLSGRYPWNPTPKAKLEKLRTTTQAALVEARLSLVTAQTVIRWHEDTLKQVEALLAEEDARQPKRETTPAPQRPPL
jgi:hypothetical protein